MNKLLKLSCLSLFLALVMSSCSSQKKYSYETVPNDPLKARIYTLDNGLKVYLTVKRKLPAFKHSSPCGWAERTTRQKRPDWHTTLNT